MAKNNNTLVFNGLMQGMSWDLIKEAKDEIKRRLGEKPPTRKDILTNWIIGKDYMLQLLGNTFQFGGGYSSWLSQFKKDNPLTDGRTNYSWGELSKGKLEDSFSNGNGVGSVLGIAGTALDWTKGFIDSVNSIDNSAQLNDAKYIAGQQINFGDNASLMNTLSNLQYADTNATATDVGGHSFGQSAMNVGKDAFSGVTTGLNIGGPIGAAIGGAVGLAKGVIQEIVTNSKAKEAAETANLISSIANDQVNQRMGYASDKSQLLAVLDQLQHTTKNGGKLKKSHKFANGGLLNNYYYGLEEVNAGGSHEENPNEGVVVSYAPDGLPNKVEEGETIHNDYVYSKRLEANKKVLNSNLLDEKYEGKSFADISKKLTEDRKQRPNDPISVRTNEENLARLQDALEELKLDNKTREVKRFLGSLNNDLLNALQLEMMDEYEAYAEQLAQLEEQEALAYQEEQAALEGMFGRGGHLKQGKTSSKISATEPIYDAEGKIIGWKQPDASTEKVLNLSGYNPNYEGALIYADDRNWFLRNIVSPWNTWWNNLPSPEFSWAVRNFTPVGAIDAILNGDTEILLAAASTGGPTLRNIFDDAEGKDLVRSLQQDRAIDKIWKNAYKELMSSKAPSKTSAPKTSTGKPKKSSTPLKLTPQEANNNTSNSVTEETRKAKFLRRLKNFGITAGISTGVGAAVNLGVKETERLKAIKDIYDSEIPILESDSVLVPYSNTNNYIYSPDSSYWYDPVEGRMFYKKSEGGRLFLDGGFAPYEFEEVNGEVFAHRNVNRNGNIVTLTIPESEFTPDMVTAYGILKQRNNSNNSNVSTKNTPVKPKSVSTTKPTTTSTAQYIPILEPIIPTNLPILDSFIEPRPFEEVFSVNKDNKPYTTPSPRNPELKPNYLSYLRYAPILGSLGLVLNDTLGLTNQPDYSNINMYRRAVDSIGGVNFVPIGGYLQYTPIDKEYIANQLLALAAAYNRSLNNVNPVGSYILGLVNDAKVRDQIGDMYINAAAQDEKNKLAVAEYNRGIDITNARNSLAAQSENARLRALRANEYLSIANMMNTERNIAEAARAANYDKFITNIGNLGKEEFAFNLVDSNAALLGYYTDRTGRARYRMPAFIKPDGFEAYKQYLKSHGVDESQIDI